jgi:hypothetical protein
MRKVLLGMVVAAGLFSGVCSAEESDERNGAWWATLSASEKLLYAAGLVDGLHNGDNIVVAGCTPAEATPMDPLPQCLEKATLVYQSGLHQFGYKVWYESRPTEQFVVGLNELYADSSNTRIPVTNAINQVARKLSGHDISQGLLRLRQIY